jgi:hypothetical protein
VAHDSSGNLATNIGRARPCTGWSGVLALCLLPACLSRQTVGTSAWPPPDFLLDVEASRAAAPALEVRRFQAWPDGFALYRRSEEALVTAGGQVLPVYATCAAYVMRPEAIRSLSRKATQTAAKISPQPGPAADAPPVERAAEYGDGTPQRLRLLCRAMGETHSGSADGASFGAIAAVLAVVNQFVPSGEEFRLPGTTPAQGNMLLDVPRPRRDLPGSLQFHLGLLSRFPADLDLVRDTFALACKVKDRAAAEAMLARYRRLTATLAEERRPPGEPQPASPEALAQLLPR